MFRCVSGDGFATRRLLGSGGHTGDTAPIKNNFIKSFDEVGPMATEPLPAFYDSKLSLCFQIPTIPVTHSNKFFSQLVTRMRHDE